LLAYCDNTTGALAATPGQGQRRARYHR
jgi:hypothetical protein